MITIMQKFDLSYKLNYNKLQNIKDSRNNIQLKERNKGYDIYNVIGHGTYAKVKLGRCRATGNNVAIKIIKVKDTPLNYSTKFMPREIEIITKLNHQNITCVREVIENESKIFIVMDLARDGDLLHFINKRGPQKEDVCRYIYRQMLEALKYLHTNGIAHRDLKCENILLDPGLKVKITDFGFAINMRRDQMLSTSCGSFAYACPEILKGLPYDGRCADVWSSGIILYALLCGCLPYDGNSARMLVKQIRTTLKLPEKLSYTAKLLVNEILREEGHQRLKVKDIIKHPFMQA
ncbi:Testis-specific serine/threonine-protein kinase 3-like [Oopsacas minuta]|uniref:Testis-specific serine/threonine-protein kinase 3-like n=1 Tax=Oopsacas minuta TaxID=111878 RepID=A0AAV7KDM6_9METZ|nr:Testis-specific serine/threonine-protein kinase 3-like [Oopsacas minuta]